MSSFPNDQDISLYSHVESKSHKTGREISTAYDRDMKPTDERKKIPAVGYLSSKESSYHNSETELMKSRVLDNVVQLQNLREESMDLRQKLTLAQVFF